MSETSPFTHLTERGEAHMVDITAKTPTVRQARARGFVECRSTVRTADRTGIEMEALTAVTVAALTIIDMVKGIDKLVAIRECYVEEKSGGRSGTWTRPSA